MSLLFCIWFIIVDRLMSGHTGYYTPPTFLKCNSMEVHWRYATVLTTNSTYQFCVPILAIQISWHKEVFLRRIREFGRSTNIGSSWLVRHCPVSTLAIPEWMPLWDNRRCFFTWHKILSIMNTPRSSQHAWIMLCSHAAQATCKQHLSLNATTRCTLLSMSAHRCRDCWVTIRQALKLLEHRASVRRHRITRARCNTERLHLHRFLHAWRHRLARRLLHRMFHFTSTISCTAAWSCLCCTRLTFTALIFIFHLHLLSYLWYTSTLVHQRCAGTYC